MLRWTTLFFASNLVIFYFVSQTGIRIGVVYYIWVGIFNVFSVAQLWSFATDLFTQAQGKRLFPLLGLGASSGAVGGAWIAGRLITPFGPYKMMLFSAGALCVCAGLTRLAGYIITNRSGEHEKKKDLETLSSEGGFQLLMRDRYLLWIAILTGSLECCEPLRGLHIREASRKSDE